MNDFFQLLLIILANISNTESSSCETFINTNSQFLRNVNGKCVAVTTKQYTGSSSTSCALVGKGVTFTRLSIDTQAENDEIKDSMLNTDITEAYIGYVTNDTHWFWINSDPSTYNNWKVPLPIPTTKPIRSTLPPSEQRRSTAIVIGIDASVYSTSALTFSQVNFASTLAQFIADRGPAEFAFFAYGCRATEQFTDQYPGFVSTSDQLDEMIRELNATIIRDCIRTDTLDFSTMFRQQKIYYNRYSNSLRPFKSKYISMIYFSSSTNKTDIQSTKSLYEIDDSSVITINVQNNSVDVGYLSLPAGKNGLRARSSSEIENLVAKVDSIIFGSSLTTHINDLNSYAESLSTSTLTNCAFLNSTDGYWYSDDSCANKRNVLCEYLPPTPEPPPTPNPTALWIDPCDKSTTGFEYYRALENAKCYKMSQGPKTFSEAESYCLTDHVQFVHIPKLTSVQSNDEQSNLSSLASVVKYEGMFWIGLKRDPQNSTNWFFINNDPYDRNIYSKWREGYPRIADGCDCVAYVLNDDSWINTDCNKNLYAICAYRFNSTNAT